MRVTLEMDRFEGLLLRMIKMLTKMGGSEGTTVQCYVAVRYSLAFTIQLGPP